MSVSAPDLQNEKSSLKSKLKCLYRSQNEIPKLIEIDDERLRQTWDDHYVELTLLAKNKLKDQQKNEIDEKKEFELENIFQDENSTKISKLLFLGEGGVGKSTLLHYICYKWGNEELWCDKFSIILRIQLKVLLDNSWKNDYYTVEAFKTNKLACFIHYNLTLQYFDLERNDIFISENEQISVEEISRLNFDDKVLLLVDGYNEVSHLAGRRDAIEFQKIMKAIYENKNTIMSSRSNALKANEIEKFDRIIESKILDLQKVTKYINSFYNENEELGASLISFLERNNQINGICEIPINMVLLCLIWADENIKQIMEENSDISIQFLYHEVILWLGKRYLVKFEDWEADNIVASTVFEQEIILFLQKIAYDSFVERGNYVNNKIIKKHLGKLNIANIYKFGILKAVGVRTDIVNLEYQFLHPTFQEFLTALNLNSKLSSNNEKEITHSCNLIGQHRNEPKYLMVLKFLAGIVSNPQSEDEEGRDDLVKRIWESFTCNVNGILEFGLEAKVTLLMHLLEQSKVDGNFDERIPCQTCRVGRR